MRETIEDRDQEIAMMSATIDAKDQEIKELKGEINELTYTKDNLRGAYKQEVKSNKELSRKCEKLELKVQEKQNKCFELDMENQKLKSSPCWIEECGTYKKLKWAEERVEKLMETNKYQAGKIRDFMKENGDLIAKCENQRKELKRMNEERPVLMAERCEHKAKRECKTANINISQWTQCSPHGASIEAAISPDADVRVGKYTICLEDE
jgi:chromosome segregation ATPase